MAINSNRNKGEKDPELEDVINQPVPPEEALPDDRSVVEEDDGNTPIPEDEKLPDDDVEPVTQENPEEEEIPEETPIEPETPTPHVETQEEKDKRYRAQQSEAQILAEKDKQLKQKIDEASKLPEPTEEEVRQAVAKDGLNWDQMTETERIFAKKSLRDERRFEMINAANQAALKIDEWATTIDGFIDSTDGKPEYLSLSGHEAEFRKYAMQATHRGVEIDVLLNAFLYTIPSKPKERRSLFNRGGGGEREEHKQAGVITDANEARLLRTNNPREYQRKLKAHQIQIPVE
jgi:hypothetical protein